MNPDLANQKDEAVNSNSTMTLEEIAEKFGLAVLSSISAEEAAEIERQVELSVGLKK